MASSTRALMVPAQVLALSELTLTARLVLAEIIDLYKVGGRVFAGDDHFADRLCCTGRSVRSAIADLEEAGHLEKNLNYARRQKRLLVPTDLWKNFPEVGLVEEFSGSASIVPEDFSTSPEVVPEKFSTTSGKIFHDFRKNLPGVPENSSNINTTINNTLNSTLNFSPDEGAIEEKKEGVGPEENPVVVEVEQPAAAPPPKEKVAPKRKSPGGAPRVARSGRPDVPFLESELASLDAFEAAFAGTDYALANLRYYHEKIASWRDRRTGEPPKRKDWKATAKQFFLNDIKSNSLVLAPGAQQYSGGSPAADAGARPGSYRSSRYDS